MLIIGAGLAGWTTAREFRKLDATTPVLLVTADSGDFYAKPSLSNAFAQGRTPEQLISTSAAKMAETLNVTLLPHTRVEAINTAGKTVTTTNATLAYSQLVLAANLAGQATELVFPLMPVAVKTPALALVIALPKPGSRGQWIEVEPGLWQWLDDSGVQRGFALAGAQTAQRMAQSRRVVL